MSEVKQNTSEIQKQGNLYDLDNDNNNSNILLAQIKFDIEK
jgi:hypothetical protein